MRPSVTWSKKTGAKGVCLGVFAERRERDADVTVLSEARQFFSPRARV